MKTHAVPAKRLGLSVISLIAASFLSCLAIDAAETKPPSPTPAPAAVKATATGPTYASFDTFRIIDDRNIFDPNRISRTARNNEDPPRGDMLTFVGTMQYEKGFFAFFDGSNASFRKAIHETEPIAQYTVTHIAADSVDLMRDGQPITLRIGQQLRRPIGGDWALAGADFARSEAGPAPPGTPTEPPPPPPAASDTLKRLMEQRQKQLK